MIRFLFRFFGMWLLAGAFVALVIDGTRSIGASRIVLTPLGEAWSALHPQSLFSMQAWVEQRLIAWVWDPVLISLLFTPLWIVLGVLGLLFVLLGRPRARPIGYSSRD
jgi:hypothetical protein